MEQQKEEANISLEMISSSTLTIFNQDLEYMNQLSDKYKYLIDDDTQKTVQTLEEVKLPVIGDVSAGKSSLINAICKFPISPVAQTTTSSCPLEIRFASETDERLEVASISESNMKDTSGTIYYVYGKDMQMDMSLFQELYDYAVELAKKQIIQIGDTLAYFEAPDPSFLKTSWNQQSATIKGTILNPKNRRHVMHLLLILLGAYVFQDKPREKLSPNQQDVLKSRDQLMKKLHIPNNITYLIRLYWYSELIPQGTVIVDLPGLGAAAEDGNGQMKHDDQVQKYLDDVPSLMFLLSPSGKFESNEAKLTLNTFIKTNDAKKSPARTLFVLNKADWICGAEDGMTSDADKIRTAINQYITNYPEYKEYPFYAISARSGEKYFEESGIPLDNMFATRLNRKVLGYMPIEQRRILANTFMNGAFNRNFISISNGKTEQMNLPTFICRFFSEEVGKIRLLHMLDEMEDYFDCIERWISKTDFALKQLEVAESFGDEIFEILSKSTEDALNKIFNDILAKFLEISDAFYKNLFLESVEISGVSKYQKAAIKKEWENAYEQVCDRVEKQGSVINIFEQCDEKLSSAINKKIEAISFSQRQTTFSGRLVIPLDREAQFSDMAKGNYDKLVACGNDIAKINFMSYFDPAFKRLKEVFDQDRQVYSELVNKIVKIISDIPNQMRTDMTNKFEKIWMDAKKRGVDETLKNDFQKLYTDLINSMVTVLKGVLEKTVSQLKKDDRLESVIDETVNKIRAALTEILVPYTKNFGDTIYNQVKEDVFSVFLRRMNKQVFDEFVKNNYIYKFNDQMKSRLRDILYGGSQSGTQNGHTQRVNTAVTAIKNDYLSTMKQQQIKNNLMNLIKIVGDIQQTPEAVNRRRNELLEAVTELQQFFVEDPNKTVYGWLKKSLMEKLANSDWASITLRNVEEKADAAKKKIEEIKKASV